MGILVRPKAAVVAEGEISEPLVGRSRELEVLRGIWERVASGRRTS